MQQTEEQKQRSLTREVEAVQIPSGEPLQLPALSKVYITQQLGGSYTVMTDFGLARIDGRDADALGQDIADEQAAAQEAAEKKKTQPSDETPDEEAIWQQLRNVYDPEIPVNIVDLGLVYSMVVEETENKASKVVVQMTLTAPGCGMGPAIAEDARSKVMLVPGVDEAEVNLVWEPAWDQSMISEEGRMILGLV
ncbi:putative Fe-S cluster assembly protein SufT [Pelagicoccus sp. SDUM812003]|uniref:putative Fe-S cluster assembly protein SufT n=1 Tax=Pelagicoccus sp. SDUM812003 TaxID=3041267 RepID=UPI00280D8C73|nr:putative Fe-S cluster assembly protein SufT [Pelagicoccus sp. SDUM812003]MDQ8202015.1 putative Fe-S cluster assembly protein SufT [Pelagicoccus sp. SDUM812003]